MLLFLTRLLVLSGRVNDGGETLPDQWSLGLLICQTLPVVW